MDTVENLVTNAMNPEEINLEDFVKGLAIAEDTIEVYSDLARAKELSDLMVQRSEEIATRNRSAELGKPSDLSISDEDEDTIYDDRINELVQELEETKMVFHVQTVAPALRKAIVKKAQATAKDLEGEALEAHKRHSNADLLRRAIKFVDVGVVGRDSSAWTAERLIAFEDTIFESQSERLIQGLWDIILVGSVFEEAITSDFS